MDFARKSRLQVVLAMILCRDLVPLLLTLQSPTRHARCARLVGPAESADPRGPWNYLVPFLGSRTPSLTQD